MLICAASLAVYLWVRIYQSDSRRDTRAPSVVSKPFGSSEDSLSRPYVKHACILSKKQSVSSVSRVVKKTMYVYQTLNHVRVTIAAVEKQDVLHILSVCS